MTSDEQAADPQEDELLADALDEPADDRELTWTAALRHPTRRGWMMIAAGITTLVLLAVAFLLPVPFVKLAPGPTFNVVGTDSGKDVIAISGTQTYPTSGSLDMTTVMETGGPGGGLTFVDAIASWLNPSDAVVPRELLFPDNESGADAQQRQALLFSTSQSNAVAAAMSYLKRPVTTEIVVDAVYTDTPAYNVLMPKDVILKVDGVSVTAATQVAQAVRNKPVGTTFTFDITRDGKPQTVTVTSADNPDKPGTPYIGIGVGELYGAGFPIDFTLQDVGGPSAGLMFAMGIVDKLTPDDLAMGHHIAGTGTIDPDGTVGPIGGIRQKLSGARNAGATLFLMPKDHCGEAAGHIPDGLTVVPVSSLSDAVAAVQAYTAGKPVASCPAGTA